MARRNRSRRRLLLLLLVLGITFVWQLRRRREAARPAATGAAAAGAAATGAAAVDPAASPPTAAGSEATHHAAREQPSEPASARRVSDASEAAEDHPDATDRDVEAAVFLDMADQGAGAVRAEPEPLGPGEVARILGCGPDEASQLVNGGPATREAVERLALQHYRWRRHVDNPESYWVTLKQASTILGVSTQRLKRLLDSGEVPCVVHRDGVRLMRREELGAAASTAEGKI